MGPVSAFNWTLMVAALGLGGTVEAVSLSAAQASDSAAVVYAVTWLAVWLFAERRQRLPNAADER